LRVCLDTGNLLMPSSEGNAPQPDYDGISRLASYAVLVHAKTYFGGGEWYTVDLDYRRIAQILTDTGFQGYVSLEFEGKEDPETGVPRSVALLRESWGC
jgi:sugar phosphate isomerase/epimerase